MPQDTYRGWVRPGPRPPGGVETEPGETLSYISGHFRIFQYERGHRFSTDDVLTAWYGTQCVPRAGRIADLGSGIGSVALVAAWRLPGAFLCTVEAQERSIRLARKSARYNGLEPRFRILQGDLRDPGVFASEPPFDLVLGSPPYYPPGTATPASHPQAVPARIEVRGTVEDYARAAARILAPGGLFAFVLPSREKAVTALAACGLTLVRSRGVVFREGSDPRIHLFAAMRAQDLPASFGPDAALVEPPLVIRRRDGRFTTEYAVLRLSFGFPPDVPEEPS